MPPSTSITTSSGRSARRRAIRSGVVAMKDWPGEARVHREHVDVVELGGELGHVLDRGARVDRQAGAAAGLPDHPEQAVRVRIGLDVDRDRVGHGGEERDHVGGPRDHQVDVHQPARGVDRLATARVKSGPIVRLGTKWPSITSTWATRAPAPISAVELGAQGEHVGRHHRRQHHPLARQARVTPPPPGPAGGR